MICVGQVISFNSGLRSPQARLFSRVPLSLKVFLLALAIADDLGAILVIAVFYTDDLAFGWLGVAAAALAATTLMGRAGVRDLTVYGALAVVAWLVFKEDLGAAKIAGIALICAGTDVAPVCLISRRIAPSVKPKQ